ncbi:MAG: prolyl oligopeptidase family serine peptidase, partial [Halobaculum sp.]
DEPNSQIWLFDLALGGDARQVTEFDEGAGSYDWGPAGDRLVVEARHPTDEEEAYLQNRRDGGPVETERLQHKLNGVGYLDTVDRSLHVVDVATGETERVPETHASGAFADLGGLQPDWGSGGRIAFCSCRVDRPDDSQVMDVYTVDPEGDDLRKLTDSDLSAGQPTWDESGQRVAFTAGDPDNWCVPTEVYLHDEDGVRSLTAELDRTVARAATLDWDGDTIYTLIADEARTRLLRVGTDATTERLFEAQGEDRAITGFAHGDRAVLTLSHPQEGHDVYAVDGDDLSADEEPASFTRLSDVNAELIGDHSMPAVRRVTYENDGWEISGVVYHDPEVEPEAGDHPLVVAIHGGPLSYDEPVFSFSHAALTSRGYVVFRPNYRGGSSYGQAFAETLYGQWGTVEVDDVAAGVESLADRGWIDTDRVFGYGFSYGGISQGFLVTQTDLFTAAAPEHGIYDLRSSFGTDDSHTWSTAEFGLPWENPETYDAHSAIADAGEIDTPLLVTAGGRDWRCPPSQSEQLYVAARKQDVPARLVIYEDEHHNIGDPDRAIHRLEEVTAWYERHDPAVEAPEADDPHGRRADDGVTAAVDEGGDATASADD